MKNVLFLLVDCLRADKCWGPNKGAQTPAIDILSERGTVFSNAVTAATTTTPSVASILTGTYSFTHGIESLSGYKLNSHIMTLPEVFKRNGYRTYAEATGPLLPETGLNRGFDYYNFRKRESIYSKWGESLIKRFRDGEFEEPWFAFIHLFELHLPRIVPKDSDTEKYGKNRYDQALSALNTHLMRLLNQIDYDKTVITLTADHGERMAESRLGEFRDKLSLTFLGRLRRLRKDRPLNRPIGHGFHVYDYLIKVPLIFVAKDLFPGGKVVPNMVRSIDVFPTIGEALRLKGMNNVKIHGQSLMPLIKGEELPEVPAYCEACGVHIEKSRWLVGIRTSKYKFVYSPYNEKIPPELYDLENDPLEKRNIISEKPEIARELKQKLIDIRSGKLGEPASTREMSKDEERIVIKRLKELGYI